MSKNYRVRSAVDRLAQLWQKSACYREVSRTVIVTAIALLSLLNACETVDGTANDSVEAEASPQSITPTLTATVVVQVEDTGEATMPTATNPSNQPGPIAGSIQQRILAIEEAALAGETDFSYLSDPLLQVRSNGAIEMVFHAADMIGEVEESELEALGAEIVISTADITWPEGVEPPAGLGQIQAWLRYDRVQEAAQLRWVSSITPPSYGATD